MNINNDNEWLTDHCLVCSAVNHIFLPDGNDPDAWECWACLNLWWFDDVSKDLFIIEHDVDDDEADDMLTNCHELVRISHGHAQRS